jgi:outer membrane protein OmpA-like peptidoglycan-associated protein
MALATFAQRARRVLALSTLSLSLLAASPAYAQSVTFGSGAGAAAPAAPAAAAPAGAAPAAAAAPADAAPAAAAAPAGAAPAAAAPAAGAAEEAVPEEGGGNSPEWQERDRQLGEASSLGGGVGLLHMQHAQGGAPGQFRMGFTSEFFSSGWLCSTTATCPALKAGQPTIKTDTMNHIGATLTLSATLLKWLEAYAVTGAYANSDSANNPGLLQVLGDTTLGAKIFGGLGKVFWIGGGPDLILVNGSGAVGLDGGATSAKFRAISTVDLRGMESRVPLRFGMNLTYSLDNTGDVVAATEAAQAKALGLPDTPIGIAQAPVSRIDRFGLEFNRVDHFDMNFGVETFLANERIRPFLEYGVEIPINRQDYLCALHPKTGSGGDACLANDADAPSKLTLGSRFYPWKNGFSLLLAVDIGVTGVSNFIQEVAPEAPWTLYIGAGWAIDVWDRPANEVTKLVAAPVAAAPTGHIKGVVHEKDKDTAIANAIVAFDGHPDITSLATAPDGHFTTSPLPPGPYKFDIHADAYKDGVCEAQIPVTQQDVAVDCPLEALPRVGNVVGHVRDIETQGPVANASLKIEGPNGRELRATSDSDGSFKFENVPPGAISIVVDASGYLALVQTATVKIRQDNNVDLSVLKKPKNPLVAVTDKEITIKQQVQFALDSAVILPESTGLMTEIADVIIHNPRITRLEVQGHTDNTGTPDHNKILSEQRANAVRDWLTAHGVQPDRLVARGYGQDKPLVPNVTPAMKAKNRRVQFIIVEQMNGPSLNVH